MRVVIMCLLMAVFISGCADSQQEPPPTAQPIHKPQRLQLNREQLTIDVYNCPAQNQRITGEKGFAKVWVRGARGERCKIDYGYHVDLKENPSWHGKPILSCLVPRQLQFVSLPRQQTAGLELTPIVGYCRNPGKPFDYTSE